MGISKKDPAFLERRNDWLREFFKESLRVRAKTVLGPDGPELLQQFLAASPAGVDVDYEVRSILRKCAKLPAGRQRLRYFRECIRNAPKGGPDAPRIGGFDSLVAKLGRDEAEKLFNLLWDSIPERHEKFDRIMLKAAATRTPFKYVRACIRNERRK